MSASEALVTQRINKIAKLRQAEEMLRNASGNYATQLNRINQEIARLNRLNEGQVDSYGRVIRSQRNLVNTSQQLTRQLALLFSVSQIEGYISKLIQVRGEFELQNTALAAMLDNKDQADRLFGQITELAVRSPFTIKELTTYTKSLAAYQVQYEDLYDTTKMLADVSAGLGVDMQRLILAFGQVKAANILRGTELRQFTEAGVNMLSELAKYYSELENRMVSVGEVQEMVTKRMVSFGDVEEVFKRITSAGGLFYNMQEKQADTLRGQMMNLQDQIDLMLNDIGKSNQTTISAIISLVKSVIENWRTIAQVMEPIASILVLYLTATKGWVALAGNIPKIWKSIQTNVLLAVGSITKAEAAQRGFNNATRLNAWLAIGAVVATIIWEVVNAIRAAGEEQRKYNAIVNEGSLKASELGANFERLADQAVNAADGSKEQKAALDELNRTYSGILSQDDLKIEKLREMKGAYDGVITAIYNKIEADTKENLLQEVNSTYGAEAVEALNDLAKRLEDFGISSDRARTIVAEFRKEWDAGNISSASAYTKLQKIIEDFTGKYYELTEFGIKANDAGKEFGQVQIKALDDATTALTRYETKRNEILGRNLIPFRAAGGTEIYEQLHNQFEEVGKLKEEWEKENYGKFDMTIEFTEESKKQQIQAYQEFINDINERINSGKITGVNVTSALLVIEEAQKEIDKLNVSSMVKQIDELRLKFSQLTGIDFGKLNFTQMMPTDSFNEYIKGLNSVIEGYDQAIKVFDEAKAANEELPWMQRESLLQGMDSEEELRSRAAAVKAFKDAIVYEPSEPTKGGSKNPELDKLKEQLKIIQQVEDAYRKYREYMSKEEASSMAKQLAEGTVAESVVGTLSLDTSELIEGLEQFSKEAFQRAGEAGQKAVDEVTRKYKEKNVIDIEVEGIEEARKRVESIFQSYEFSLELNTKGIDANAFKEMLKAVGATDAEISLMGLNTTTFKEAQQQLRDEIFKLQQEGGKKQLDEAKKIQEQLTALEIKEANKRFDELLNLREKYQTNEEKIADIETDIAGWQSELDKINELGEEGNQTQKELLEYRIQNGKDTILQLRSEALQLTEFWETLFGDLGEISISSIRDMMRQRDEIIANVSPIKNNQGETSGYSSSFIDAKGQKQEVQMTIGQYNQLIKAYQKLKDEYRQRNPLGNFVNSLKEGRKEGESFSDYLQRLALDFEALADESFAVADSIMSMTGASSESQQMMQGAKDIVGGTLKGITGFISGDPLAIIGGLATAIGGIFKIGDAKKEKQIQRQLELVEDLQHAYEKLKEEIDNAYSIDQLNAASDQAEANLKQQAAALEEAIRLEEDKKKTDKDKLKEYQQQLEDVYDQLEESQQEKISKVTNGILDDVLSAADEFTNAWLESFREVGDGMDGLNENFQSMLEDMLKRQASMLITGAYIDRWKKELEKYINADDLELTAGEAKNWVDAVTSSLPGLNKALEEYFKAMKQAGFDLTGEGKGDTLTGLQRGIESITHEQSDALQAFLSSIRYFVSDENTTIHNIYNWLLNPPVESPLMQEMKLQTTHLSSIDSLLGSVIKNSSGKGRIMRVEIV